MSIYEIGISICGVFVILLNFQVSVSMLTLEVRIHLVKCCDIQKCVLVMCHRPPSWIIPKHTSKLSEFVKTNKQMPRYYLVVKYYDNDAASLLVINAGLANSKESFWDKEIQLGTGKA